MAVRGCRRRSKYLENNPVMQSFNIVNGLEANTYSWRKANPPNPEGLATSEVETRTYSGAVEYLKNTLAAGLLAAGNAACQVSCSIVARGGGMGELTVTRTWYDAPEEEGGGESGGESGGPPPAGSVGSSAENPVYAFQVTENRIPILLHPIVQDASIAGSSPQGIALRMLSNGADENATFTTGTADNPVAHTVGEALESVPAAVKNLVTKQSSYLSAGLVLDVRWQIDGKAAAPALGDFFKIATPEGGIGAPTGRNWLLAGGGATLENGKAFMTKKYILSEPGGWDETLYS